MLKEIFWDKFSTKSEYEQYCIICSQPTNNYLIIFDANKVKNIICKNCSLSGSLEKNKLIQSLNELHFNYDLLADQILVYEKFINSTPERKEAFKRFRDQIEIRKEIRNIDG